MSALKPKIVIHFERMDEWPRDATGKLIFQRPCIKRKFDTRLASFSSRMPIVPDLVKTH